jgi:hypothetical protein
LEHFVIVRQDFNRLKIPVGGLSSGATATAGRLGVSRSVSLPDQLGSLGSAELALAVEAALAPSGVEITARKDDDCAEDREVQSIAESMLPMKL